MKYLSILYFLLILSYSGFSANYYIGINGNDTNSGTQLKPWKTIYKASTTAVAGDNIYINEGTYQDNINFTISGKTNERISYYSVGNVIQTGQFTIIASNITISGFDFPGPRNLWTSVIRVRPTAHRTWILDNKFHDFQQAYPIGMETISGIRDPSGGPQQCIIQRNTFEHIGYIHLNIFGDSHYIAENYFANSFGEGDVIRPWGANHRFVSNIMTNIGGGDPGLLTGGHPDLLQVFGDYGFASYNLKWERNYAINNKCQICQLEQKGVVDIRDWDIQNNIFINQDLGASCSFPGLRWKNNLFYKVSKTAGHVIFLSDNTSGRGLSDRNEIINNIFFMCGSNPTNNIYGWYSWPTNLTDFKADYNFVCGPNFAPKRTDPIRTTWRFVEPHGINGGNPGFINDLLLNFKLKPDSILINKGLEINTFNNDFLGNLRPQGISWDIGPYEMIFDSIINPPQNFKLISQ